VLTLALGIGATTTIMITARGQSSHRSRTLAHYDYEHRLFSHGVPVIAIDTSDMDRTGFRMDVIGRGAKAIPDWRAGLHLKLLPVPVAVPRADQSCYAFVPAVNTPSTKVRRHVRRPLGIGDDDRVLLYRSARWQ
jgi:hypothetical protein